MVNIVVVVPSPLGNCLRLGVRDAVSLDEASLVKKNPQKTQKNSHNNKNNSFFKNSSSLIVRSADLFTHRPHFSFAQVNLLSLDFRVLAQHRGPVSLAALCACVAPRCREQFRVKSQE